MKKRKLKHQREVQDVVAQLRPIDDIMFQRLCEKMCIRDRYYPEQLYHSAKGESASGHSYSNADVGV